MSPSVSLTAAARANLTALQAMSTLQAAVQYSLATGRKVNSALDNPTNFFTAAALTGRASELTHLLDAMGNGVSTLKAAEAGLTSIATTIQSMEATVREARQDARWQSTSYGVDAAAIGIAEPKTIAFSGGAVGSAPVPVALNSVNIVAAPMSSSAGAPFSAMPLSPAVAGSVVAPNAYNATNAFSGGHVMGVRFDATHSTVVAFPVAGQYTLAAAIDRINQTLVGYGATVRASDAGGHLMLADTAPGAASNFEVLVTKVSSVPLIYEGGFTSNLVTATNGADAVGSAGFTIAVNGGAAQTVSVAPNDVVNAGVDASNGGFNSVNMAAAINAKLAAAGITNVQAVKSGAAGVSAATDTFSLQATTTGPGTTFRLSGITGDLIGGNVTVGNDASPGSVFTVDQLVESINGNPALAGKVKARKNAGQLQITNGSTAPLTVSGIAGSGLVNGSAGIGTIPGNTTRAGLVTQFNQLKDQLDKFAADASFNGINLLAGDPLKLDFNETGASSITVQSIDTAGINSESLAIGTATDAEFLDNAALDARLQRLRAAARAVASQASAFGSKLSTIENRRNFTGAMVSTLQTGADGLTLTDTNQDGAGMLALQTRQQLSTTALSLASQASRAVLRLFG